MLLKPGNAVWFVFNTYDDTGANTNADSLPTASVYRNGSVDGTVTVTVTSVSTGLYKATFTIPGGYSSGDSVIAVVTATVSGVTASRAAFSERLIGIDSTQTAWSAQLADVSHGGSNAIITLRSVAVTNHDDGATAFSVLADGEGSIALALSATGLGGDCATINSSSGIGLTINGDNGLIIEGNSVGVAVTANTVGATVTDGNNSLSFCGGTNVVKYHQTANDPSLAIAGAYHTVGAYALGTAPSVATAFQSIIPTGTGTTGYVVHLRIPSDTDPKHGVTGLVFNTSGLKLYYVNSVGSSTAVTLVDMPSATYVSGGFHETDSTNMPGVYRIGIPNSVFSGSANDPLFMLYGAAGMAPVLFRVATKAIPADLPNLASPANLINVVIDGSVSLQTVLTRLNATARGKNSSIHDNGNGTDTVSWLKEDNSTTSHTVTFNTTTGASV